MDRNAGFESASRRSYFGTLNDTAPPLHMPSDRISRRRKSAPSSSMVNASGLISAVLPGFGGLHGLGDKPCRSRLARSLGAVTSVAEPDPSHNATLQPTSGEPSSGPTRSRRPSGTARMSRMPRPPPTSTVNGIADKSPLENS